MWNLSVSGCLRFGRAGVAVRFLAALFLVDGFRDERFVDLAFFGIASESWFGGWRQN